MKKVQIFFLVVVATIFSCKKTEPAQVHTSGILEKQSTCNAPK